MWTPQRFALLRTERMRPVYDLLSRVPNKLQGVTPSIIDVGCGMGAGSKILLERFPSAKLLCIDKDEARLKRAEEDEVLSSRDLVQFKHESAEDHFADVTGPLYDLVFSNAALHWCEDLPGLSSKMFSRVRPGGVLAIQVPKNEDLRNLFREAATELGMPVAALKMPMSSADPEEYANALLGRSCSSLDMWSTTTVHCLSGDDAVYHFIKNTFDGRQAMGMHGFEDVSDEANSNPKAETYPKKFRPKPVNSVEPEDFQELCRLKCAEAFPPLKNGTTLLPFTRMFLVARRHGLLDYT